MSLIDFSKTEKHRIKQFEEKHAFCYMNRNLSRKFKLIFKETGIGLSKTIKCCSCEAKQNITDYDNW